METGTAAPEAATAKVGRLAEAEPVSFGPLADYRLLIGDGETPIRTGVQTSAPGYEAPMHSHPYVELLFIVEGEAEAWLQGGEDAPISLKAGDCIALPANVPHAFRTVGDRPMRLLGIHHSPRRVVNYLDGESDADGYPAPGPALDGPRAGAARR